MAPPIRKTRPKRILEFSGFQSPVHRRLVKRTQRGFRYIYLNMDEANPPFMRQRDGGIVFIKGRRQTYEIPYRGPNGKLIRANTIDEFHLHLPQRDNVSNFLPKFANELNRVLRPGGRAYFTVQDDGDVVANQINFFGKDPRFRIRFA